MKKIKLILLCLFLLCTALALPACGQTDGGDTDEDEYTEEYIEDTIVPILIHDDTNMEKVVTSATFTIPASLSMDNGFFQMSKLFGDNMLLQANVALRIWGSCNADGKLAVRVRLNGGTESISYGKAENGSFEIWMNKQDYATNATLSIIHENGKAVAFNNVAFGELYIGAGQSNMGWTMGQCYDEDVTNLLYADDINHSFNEEIRLYGVGPVTAVNPLNEIPSSFTGGWNEAGINSVSNFSAVAYYFAKEINEKYAVPVGIIQSCMGGTSVYTWMPQSDFAEAKGANETPSLYYNAMIHPLKKMTVRGVLWYQGEGQSKDYAHNYSLVIAGWRREFERKLNFSTVQLPRYVDEEEYFLGREQQKQASNQNENVTYSVNIDLGLLPQNVASGDQLNPQGIHPYDKKPVGIRLAHATMQAFYGAKGTWRGAELHSVEVKEGKAYLTFKNVGKGLKLYGKNGFMIATKTGEFKPATVELISKYTVAVYSSAVDVPGKITYGLKNNAAAVQDFNSYTQSVCIYNTKGDKDEKAYPAEQFFWKAE